MSATLAAGRAPRADFLARNPFGDPWTLGFFYREKMRAIHRIAPDEPFATVLEVGGGQGGLTGLLYPHATVTNLDRDGRYARSEPNRRPRTRFVCGDATALPFPGAAFDAVTMFDLLEHVDADRVAAREAWRVLRPGGALLVSSPNEHWRFPYHRLLRGVCPSEAEIMAEWGHVRRGYSRGELEALVGRQAGGWASFLSPFTVIAHDIAFSRLPLRARRIVCRTLGPLTWSAYALQDGRGRGTENAAVWRKSASERT